MVTLVIQFNAIEVSVFLFACVLLGVTVYFFRKSLKSLKAIKEKQAEDYSFAFIEEPDSKEEKKKAPMPAYPASPFFKRKNGEQEPSPDVSYPVAFSSKNRGYDPGDMDSFKQSILQQQQQLEKLLEQIEELKDRENYDEVLEENEKLKKKVETLELELEEKEGEIQKLDKHQQITEQMAIRLEEVQKEFQSLQGKIQSLEKKPVENVQLAVELESLKESFEKLEREAGRKAEKLQEVMDENSRLQQKLYETEDKLEEANLQRQQLNKKLKLLEELNSDIQFVSETNKKLQTEMRRIGELENMLNMMMEEREQLLRKKS